MSWWNPRTWKRSTVPARRQKLPESELLAKVLGHTSYRESPRRNAADLLEAYHTIPLLRAIVDKIAEARVAVPWTLAAATASEPSKNGKKDSIRHRDLQYGDRMRRKATRAVLTKQQRLRAIENHPALDCLDRGNPVMVGHNVLTITYVHEELTGEACWVMERNRAGMPVMLWPIPPSAVKRTPTPGFPYYEIDFRDWRENVPASEVIWFCRPNPVDPYGRGSSVIGALGDEWETGEFASKHLKSFFLNRGRPELLIYGKDVKKEETDRLEEKWLSKFQGFRKAYQAFFMRGEDITVKELSQSFKDVGMVDLLKQLRDTEITALGLPPEIMGVLSSSNKATIQAAERFFARWLIVPRQERTRAILQERFLPLFDERLALDYVSPVEADRDYELEVMKARPEAFTVDEYRGKAGQEPLPEGQGTGHLVTFASKLVPTLESLVVGDAAPPVAARPPLAGPVPTRDPGEGLDDADDEEGDGSTQKRLRLVHSRKAIRKDEIQRLLDAVDPRILERVLVPIVTDAVEHFGASALAEADAGIDFEVGDPRVQQFLRTYGAERVKNLINETTRRQLGEVLAEGVSRGDTTSELAARITDVFTDAKGPRAWAIARSELTRASGFGAREGIRQAGLEQKEWLSTKDERVRDAHHGLDGQTVPVDGVFTVPEGYEHAGATASYPGDFGEPALDIECRCVLLAGSGTKALRDRTAMWKALDRERVHFERRLQAALLPAFEVQHRKALAALERLAEVAA